MPRPVPTGVLTVLLCAAATAVSDPTHKPGQGAHPGADALIAEADDVFIRHWRWRVAPADIDDFETLLRHCVASAIERGVPKSEGWILYREPPTHYWMVQIRPTSEDLPPEGTLEDFALAVTGGNGTKAAAEATRLLADLNYQTEWISIARQHLGWSTVESMSSSTHPMARIVDFSIKPGMEKAFSLAMAARTRFLIEHEYPLPIESFALAEEAPSRAWMVIFAPTWKTLHGSDSIDDFAAGLDPQAAKELTALDADLAETVSAIDFYDASFAADLYPEGASKVDEHSDG